MATREENLKKINDELEKMNDEELEKVAGGFWDSGQLADDSRFLNVLLRGRNNQPERHNWYMVSAVEMKKVWKTLGIELKDGSLFGDHTYHLNGKKISQAEAWEHAEKIIGKHLERSDWDW